MKILLKKGASNEGILDLVAEIIERYHNIQSKRIFQFLGEEVGLHRGGVLAGGGFGGVLRVVAVGMEPLEVPLQVAQLRSRILT